MPPDDTKEAIIDSNMTSNGDDRSYLVHLEPIQPPPLQEAKTVYNHFDADYRSSDIDKILTIENNLSTGTLYAKAQWKNQQESFLPIHALKEEKHLMLAQHIIHNPVDHTRSGFWNTWACTTQLEISSVNHKLRCIYSHITHARNFSLIADVPSSGRRSIQPKHNRIWE